MKTINLTPSLRFVKRKIKVIDNGFFGGEPHEVLVLQQASVCVEDGSIEWANVPVVNDSTGEES